ncbi:MAG: bifunctional [glutamate--ammonia ligase]-adenylyl-L-tyrosine phosphorylase/[glutamate--ammonia-ligase] adenylyltransferase [Verrucomicrobiales bacterium]|nr:bifunctional [glutamate--ammonia ligase]-adenylyl-L-tyrosine phosphorylase/[glutamate--ammonia-ligase] adenylyltransferase [Verrucomicrobiales bacterium]MCP5528308.1 bifunctional [glutamate--ammonia ligase]-adenylyl-L-tyrosine phosphorylase/[glutamate--ammonia-ligase] adenylyltransferase [Verrucomicrobiales bacterium]
MQTKAWLEALNHSADPDRARRFFALLADTGATEQLATATPEQARVLATVFGGSQALSEALIAHPEWLSVLWDVEGLRFPRAAQGLRREVHSWLKPGLEQQDRAGVLRQLRLFRVRETLRIAARDLNRFGTVREITRELSDVADVCLAGVFEVCRDQLVSRLGQPFHESASGAWLPTPFCVLGMGKLGGQELNYSSDVDVIFVYEEEGTVFREAPKPGRKNGSGLPSHDFFRRLSEAFIEEVRRATPEGQLYRIDLRLRPEGGAGPLARSLPSYESYYAQYGQTWERMMLIKARGVAGDRTLAGEFLETVQPFRYPRLLSPHFLQEIAAMKRRIEAEVVKAGELDRNVKLGRGGIREIEFIAQTLQILNAGKTPFLADPQTLPALAKLARYHLIEETEAEALTVAYGFLRDVEHRLQMENNLQTHSLPADPAALERLAALMGFASRKAFEGQLAAHRKRVRESYARVVPAEPEATGSTPPLEGNEDEWKQRLAGRSFRDPEQALRLAHKFVHGPGFALVTARTEELGRQLLVRFLGLCPRADDREARRREAGPDGDPSGKWLSDPDRVLARLDSFVSTYGARSVLYESWISNPSLFELLLLLFDRSEFLAESALREVDLVDALQQSGRLRLAKTAAQTLDDLRHGAGDADQHEWLRRYHRAEFMRIGLRDILGLSPGEQSLAELSSLADACLQYALEVVLRKRRYKRPPLAILGLGKLGGAELNYGSDLDVIFVADDKVRDLSRLQGIAQEVMDLIGRQTELGDVFEIDARLRPDGEKGLLVNNLSACDDYYRRRAWLWELQAISRARPIAGNEQVGERFMALVAELADFRRLDTDRIAAQKPGWRQEVVRMRQRIEMERVKPGHAALAIKTGAGGLMDGEFIAQVACLANGWLEPNTQTALERAAATGLLDARSATSLIENYQRLRRIEGILRRWSYEGESELPEDAAAFERVAIRCGFAAAADFADAVARYRAAVREVYDQFFQAELAMGS